ncbi:MAG: hypothetical protein V7604_1311, partial [Hyphomicrobiales bacterium]
MLPDREPASAATVDRRKFLTMTTSSATATMLARGAKSEPRAASPANARNPLDITL